MRVRNDPSLHWLLDSPIAHRGLHHNPDVPENSLASFQAAVEKGHPIEYDVHLSKDGVPIVFHDDDLARVTGVSGAPESFTVAELTAMKLFGTSETIPTFKATLELVAGKIPMIIETKTTSKVVGALEDAMLKDMEGYVGPYVFHSFNPYSLGYLRKVAPHIIRGQLAEDFSTTPGLSRLDSFALTNLLMDVDSRPDFVGYDINALPRLPTTILKDLGIPLLAWTIDSPELLAGAKEVADNYFFESITPE